MLDTMCHSYWWQCFPGSCGRLNIKMSYQHENPHVKDKTVSRPSYFWHGNPIPGEDSLFNETGSWYFHCSLCLYVIRCDHLVLKSWEKLKWTFNQNTKISITKKQLKLSSDKWRPFCPGFNLVLSLDPSHGSIATYRSKQNTKMAGGPTVDAMCESCCLAAGNFSGDHDEKLSCNH